MFRLLDKDAQGASGLLCPGEEEPLLALNTRGKYCLLTLGKVMAQLPLQCPWSSIHSVALSVHVPVRRDKGGWPLLQTQH